MKKLVGILICFSIIIVSIIICYTSSSKINEDSISVSTTTQTESTTESTTELLTTTIEQTESTSFQTDNISDSVIDINDIPKQLQYEIREKTFESKTSSGFLYHNQYYKYPYFYGDTYAANAWNTEIENQIKKYEDEYNNTSQADKDARYDELIGFGYTASVFPLYDNTECEVIYNKNGYVSVLQTNVHWPGGAHPYANENGYIYDNAAERKLEYNDILKGTNSEIRSTFINESNKEYENNPNLIVDISDEAFNEEYFFNNAVVLKEEGICMQYYQGGSGPMLMMTIPYSKTELYKDNFIKRINM